MTEKETTMDRDLGDFWKVQQQLAQTLQLDIARTLQAKRLHGEPTAPQELHAIAQALVTCSAIMASAEQRQ